MTNYLTKKCDELKNLLTDCKEVNFEIVKIEDTTYYNWMPSKFIKISPVSVYYKYWNSLRMFLKMDGNCCGMVRFSIINSGLWINEIKDEKESFIVEMVEELAKIMGYSAISYSANHKEKINEILKDLDWKKVYSFRNKRSTIWDEDGEIVYLWAKELKHEDN